MAPTATVAIARTAMMPTAMPLNETPSTASGAGSEASSGSGARRLRSVR